MNIAGPEIIDKYTFDNLFNQEFHHQFSWAWNFSLLINVEMPTTVGILIFMSRKISILGLSQLEEMLNVLIFYTYEHLTFHAHLTWAFQYCFTWWNIK